MVICHYHAIGQVPGTAWQGSRVEHPLGLWLQGEAGARSGAGGDCEWEPAPAGYCSSKLSGAAAAAGDAAAAGTAAATAAIGIRAVDSRKVTGPCAAAQFKS